MILKRITINNFGSIHNRTMEFAPGLNLICAKEEREILFDFIKIMFFGFADPYGKGCENDLYARYQPEQGQEYGGIIWFEDHGKHYRLTRDFGKETYICRLFCQENENVLELGSDTPAHLVFGRLSEKIYENAADVKALKGASAADFARELHNYLGALEKSWDSGMQLGRADQMLKMWRKGYLSQKERWQKDVQREQEKMSARLEELESQLDELRDRKGQVAQQQTEIYSSASREEETLLGEQIRTMEKKNLEMIAVAVIAAVVGIVGLVGHFQMGDEMSRMGMDVCMVAAVIAILYTFSVRRRLRSDLAKQKKKKARMQVHQDKLKFSQEGLDENYNEMLTAFTNIQKDYQEYETEAALPRSEDLEIQALNLAMETIGTLSGDIYRESGRKIRIRASRILRELTDGKFIEVFRDNEQHIMIDTEQGQAELEKFTLADMKLVYFAIRMAAGELLDEKTVLPVVMDALWSGCREEQIAAILKWLRKQPRQVFIRTDNSKITELLDKEQINYTKI